MTAADRKRRRRVRRIGWALALAAALGVGAWLGWKGDFRSQISDFRSAQARGLRDSGSAAASSSEDENSKERPFGQTVLTEPLVAVRPGASGAARFRPVRPGRVLLLVRSKADAETVRRAAEQAGGRFLGMREVEPNPAYRFDLNAAALDRVLAMSEVAWAENELERHLFNDVARGLVGATNFCGTVAGLPNLDGAGQFLTTSDSGVDTGSLATLHPDLRRAVAGCQKVKISGVTICATDELGHGTHTAGTLVGDGSASGGQFRGLAPGARLWALFCADSSGVIHIPSSYGSLFRPTSFREGTPCVHSASWGADGTDYDLESQSIDLYCWNHPDFLPVFAAGNVGEPKTVSREAAAKNVLAVGASESYRPTGSYRLKADNPDEIASFSSRGPTPDGRIKPDLVAPGSKIVSCRSTMTTNELWGVYDAHYLYCSGTSMATPVVAGAAVLVREYLAKERGLGSPSAALVRAILTGGARELFGARDTNVSARAPNSEEGWGRLDLAGALCPDGGRAVYLADYVPFHTGTNLVYSLEVTAPGPLDVQLAWIDYPGTVSADVTAPVLVNDLDLVVTGPDGSTWYGNGIATGDRLNPAECVRIPVAASGRYELAVCGVKVPRPSEGGGAAALYVRGAFDPAAVVTRTERATYSLTVSMRVANCAPGTYSWRQGGYVPQTSGRTVRDYFTSPMRLYSGAFRPMSRFTVLLPDDFAPPLGTLEACHTTDGWKSFAWGEFRCRYAEAWYRGADGVETPLRDARGESLGGVEITMDEDCDVFLDYFVESDVLDWRGNPLWAPTWWMLRYLGGRPGEDAAAADPDADGFTNDEEYRMGTDPVDFASRLHVDEITPAGIRWRSGAEVPQVLERASSLGARDWRGIYTNVAGTVQTWYNFKDGESNGFYRINIPGDMQR